MQCLIMDMPLMISVARWHTADRHGKTEEVALAIEGDIHRCDHANARTQQLGNALPRVGVQPGLFKPTPCASRGGQDGLAQCRRVGQEKLQRCQLARTYLATSIVQLRER